MPIDPRHSPAWKTTNIQENAHRSLIPFFPMNLIKKHVRHAVDDVGIYPYALVMVSGKKGGEWTNHMYIRAYAARDSPNDASIAAA